MRVFGLLLIVVGMLSTLGIVFAGFIGMTRSNQDPMRSNQLMRWRVILQASTLALVALGAMLMQG